MVGKLCETRLAAGCALTLQGYVQDFSVAVSRDFQSVLALVIGTRQNGMVDGAAVMLFGLPRGKRNTIGKLIKSILKIREIYP